jgi:hypothetical protein
MRVAAVEAATAMAVEMAAATAMAAATEGGKRQFLPVADASTWTSFSGARQRLVLERLSAAWTAEGLFDCRLPLLAVDDLYS